MENGRSWTHPGSGTSFRRERPLPVPDFPTAPPGGQIWRSWLILGDALSVQRVYLHRDESAQVAAACAPAPRVDGIADAAALVATPATIGSAAGIVSEAGLTGF